jgi:hypothetical protein
VTGTFEESGSRWNGSPDLRVITDQAELLLYGPSSDGLQSVQWVDGKRGEDAVGQRGCDGKGH